MRRYGPQAEFMGAAGRLASRQLLAFGGGAKLAYKHGGYASRSKARVRTKFKPQVTRKTYTNSKKKLPRRKGVKRDVAKLQHAMRDMKLSENASLGKLTFRSIRVSRLLCAVNVQAQVHLGQINTSQLELAAANLQYFDPSAPATLITAPIATGTYSRKILFRSCTSAVRIKNNYQSDAHVTVYLCKVRDDTDQTPEQAFTNVTDDAEQGTALSVGMYPTDSALFRQLYVPKRMFDGILAPGKQVRVSHTEGPFEYDPAVVDTHNLAYQREYKAFAFLVILKGTLGHDTSADDQGLLQAGIDMQQERTMKIEYDAGINLNRIYIDNVFDAPANAFVQSNQPIPDNVGYSVA